MAHNGSTTSTIGFRVQVLGRNTIALGFRV